MSADRITYCLERLTDYRDFERFCSALLAGSGYPGIDPLGGSGDGGRDAIVRSDADGRTVGFAFTVREDWKVKLKGDADRLTEKRHKLDALVFVCTAVLNATEKDWACNLVKQRYGWTLDLFDLERLRVLLVGAHRHLIAQHPSIFTPPFFPQAGGVSLSESRDILVIDHVDADHALATWLARRLSLAGYSIWCRGIAPMAGENLDEAIRALIGLRAAQYLPIVSASSLTNEAFRERCVVASSQRDLVLPCAFGPRPQSGLPSKIAGLSFAEFDPSWREGLNSVLARLKTLGRTPDLTLTQGRRIALGDYLPTRVTVAKPEPVYANVFPLQLPEIMKVFEVSAAPSKEQIVEWQRTWPCVRLADRKFAAFADAPSKVRTVGRVLVSWRNVQEREGRRTQDIAKELARLSLEAVCAQKGLKYCDDRKVYYYPERPDAEWVQPIRHVDGRDTKVNLTGHRTKGYGERASTFLYQLAPRFSVQCDYEGQWTVVINPYVRVTTIDGELFERKEIGRRRKVVSRSWWNNQWLSRLLGVVQGLETGPGVIQFGVGEGAVVLQSSPLRWECPVGLDVAALSATYDIGEEMATYRAQEADDEQDDVGAVEASSEA